MIYSIDVAPNLASRAGLILSTMATKTTFYDWELKDNVYKLMRKDIDMLYRRRFDACKFFAFSLLILSLSSDDWTPTRGRFW